MGHPRRLKRPAGSKIANSAPQSLKLRKPPKFSTPPRPVWVLSLRPVVVAVGQREVAAEALAEGSSALVLATAHGPGTLDVAPGGILSIQNGENRPGQRFVFLFVG